MTERIRISTEIGSQTVQVGVVDLTFRSERATGSVFEYDRSYLAHRGAYSISPELPLSSGPIPVTGLPGAMSDAAPDAWGRLLIRRQRTHDAQEAGRPQAPMTDADALLGVSDTARIGALRFRASEQGEFLAHETTVPPQMELGALLDAADRVAEDDWSAIKRLLDAGTASLGGARPKALVRAEGRLAIAKFPSPVDEHDVIRWEGVALELARRAGIRVPLRSLVTVDTRAVLVLDRFDRGPEGERIPYWSAMTLLEAQHAQDGDYLDLGQRIADSEAQDVQEQLRELWRRAAFSVLVHNTDDHLKNHGFLLRPRGWELSPAFDINPNPIAGSERAVAIAGAVAPAHEPRALGELAREFGIPDEQWKGFLRNALDATGQWRTVAAAIGLDAAEIHAMTSAFEGPVRDKLADLAQ